MSVSKRRTLKAFTGGMVLTSALIAAIMTGGVAVAVPMGGVGGFTVTFDKMEASGMQMYPTTANNSACASYPSAATTLDSGTIYGMTLYKDIKMPTGDTMRIQMSTDKKIQFRGMAQKFTYLNGDFEFNNGQTISQNPNGEIKNRFTLSADSVTIRDAKINAQSQFVRSIKLNDMTVRTKLNPTNDTELGNTNCAKAAS